MPIDEVTGEQFLRVVGARKRPPPGQPPTREAREALAKMPHYRTRAPKGVFIYKSHEEANAERERWLVEAIIERALAQKR